MDSYEEFKIRVKSLIDLDLNYYKEQQMKRRIESLIKKNNCSTYEAYYKKLISSRRLLEEFISFLTINVTEFYRNPEQWKIFDERIVPYLVNNFGKSLNIWSAACSSGEEPYTVACILSKYIPVSRINIYATDIDKRVLDIAKEGVYSEKAVKSMPEDIKKNLFIKDINGKYRINESIKNSVHFAQSDLLKKNYPKDMHLIICRNMMIYMTQEAKDIMYTGFNDSLVSKGLLFIGSTENILRPEKYNFENYTSFFYKKK